MSSAVLATLYFDISRIPAIEAVSRWRFEHESPAQLARKAIAAMQGAGNKTIAIFAAAALLACGLGTVFVEPLRLGFFTLIFGLDIILAITSIGIQRVIGTLLALVQLPLLAGFAYQYFHRVLFAGEVLLLIVFSLNASMR